MSRCAVRATRSSSVRTVPAGERGSSEPAAASGAGLPAVQARAAAIEASSANARFLEDKSFMGGADNIEEADSAKRDYWVDDGQVTGNAYGAWLFPQLFAVRGCASAS